MRTLKIQAVSAEAFIPFDERANVYNFAAFVALGLRSFIWTAFFMYGQSIYGKWIATTTADPIFADFSFIASRNETKATVEKVLPLCGIGILHIAPGEGEAPMEFFHISKGGNT